MFSIVIGLVLCTAVALVIAAEVTVEWKGNRFHLLKKFPLLYK